MAKHSILLVEDVIEVQMIVQATLDPLAKVTCCSTSAQAWDLLKTETFSLIILDVMLPDEDGFQLCAKLRQNELHRDVPVFFLTGKTKPADKVLGFSLGADDYITKPLEPQEFLARVGAKLKKIDAANDREAKFVQGPFQVDMEAQRVTIQIPGGDVLEPQLTPIEFKLLVHLLKHQDHVFSREQILKAVWGRNVHVTDRTVDTHMSTLRKKLGPYKDSVASVPRVGYRFTLPKNKAA